MRKQNIILAIIALFFGFFIFTSSLLMASQNDTDTRSTVSEKTFYTGKTLPDHVFYPILMVFDRGLLFLTSGEKEVQTRIYLAEDRMESAKLLLKKDQEPLALTTITKSQKYLILAVSQFTQIQNPSAELRDQLISALEDNTQELKNCKSEFKTVDSMPIEKLVIESETLISMLSSGVEK